VRDVVLNRVIEREGGAASHPADKGGSANFGLTRSFLKDVTAREWSDVEIRSITREIALSVYSLWLSMSRLDQLPDDIELADAVIDFAVNSGSGPAIRAIQKAMGLPADGVAGAQTQGEWHLLDDDERERVRKFVLAARLEHLGSILSRDHTQAVFALGWLRRVAAQVRA
jgi:lysozyme family protein